jgi:hypothetical protein
VPWASPARVTVEPEEATVTVDGKIVPVKDGAFEVSGEPGDSFEIAVSHSGRQRRERVVITKEGTATPERVAVVAGIEPTPAPSAAREAPPREASTNQRPERVPSSKPSTPTKPAEPPTLKPAPTPAPTLVGPKENW